ncbi:hypothetical protein ELH73_26485 (plasmid) [Rhizobium leguminosarum]|uniref:Uncharacterized protein n=1 Tax=Rhizobium leguminosarum TaxID=384 RepID=A0ABD7PIF9_RHILE|nr:hypothetical protein HA461_28175 [Rhizobium leguminosarum bv. trifolii]TAV65918.1 hypothetical protein ELI28_25930 [Rhizobium leguminosarum]TAV65989.1 hypothetical protein ELI27_27255 [Rhizobium leguminosarum]TAW19631.1 hypothetical protein ELI19_31025 [Rhizobium leguminosarum]TAW38138.1 hypothetical protein ELI18_27525 [Rhizobium leguminosarum]
MRHCQADICNLTESDAETTHLVRLRGDRSTGVLADNGIAVSWLPLEHPELLPLPADVKEGRYFLYRRT